MGLFWPVLLFAWQKSNFRLLRKEISHLSPTSRMSYRSCLKYKHHWWQRSELAVIKTSHSVLCIITLILNSYFNAGPDYNRAKCMFIGIEYVAWLWCKPCWCPDVSLWDQSWSLVLSVWISLSNWNGFMLCLVRERERESGSFRQPTLHFFW